MLEACACLPWPLLTPQEVEWMQQQQGLHLQPHMLWWPHLHPFCLPPLALMFPRVCFQGGSGLRTAHSLEISV